MSKTIQLWIEGRLSQYETPRGCHVVRGTLLSIDIRTASILLMVACLGNLVSIDLYKRYEGKYIPRTSVSRHRDE
jgi:hypothetical protein